MICTLLNTIKRVFALLINAGVVVLAVGGGVLIAERYFAESAQPGEVVEQVEAAEPTIDELVEDVATSYDLPPLLLRAIVRHESGDDPEALRFEPHHMPRGRKIARNESQARMYATSIGLAQVMGWHAPEYNLSWKDLLEPRTNLVVAAEILTKCKARAKGNKREVVRQMLGCYNGDPKNYPPRVFSALGEIVAEQL